MAKLSDETCEACRTDAPLVSKEEAKALMANLDGWQLIETPINQLQKVFLFPDYQASLDFFNKVARLAEQEDHHPKIILEWGRVSVLWWSHKIKGLHRNDFICASKTEDLYLT